MNMNIKIARRTALALALTAGFAGCGVTAFEGQSGSASGQARAERNYLDDVQSEIDGEYLSEMTDDDLLEFGHAICDRLDEGESAEDIINGIFDDSDADSVDIPATVATTATIAMQNLCPDSY